MKGLKIIPMFAVLLILSYLGVIFVRANQTLVTVTFGGSESAETALGFVVLTSALVGMIISGLFCSVELLVLYMQNQKLKRLVNPSEPLQILDEDPLDSYLDEEEEIEETDTAEGEEEKPEKPKPETTVVSTT